MQKKKEKLRMPNMNITMKKSQRMMSIMALIIIARPAWAR